MRKPSGRVVVTPLVAGTLLGALIMSALPVAAAPGPAGSVAPAVVSSALVPSVAAPGGAVTVRWTERRSPTASPARAQVIGAELVDGTAVACAGVPVTEDAVGSANRATVGDTAECPVAPGAPAGVYAVSVSARPPTGALPGPPVDATPVGTFTVTTTAPAAPALSAPTQVSATLVPAGVELRWSPVTGPVTGGAGAVTYEVGRSSGGAGESVTPLGDVSTAGFLDRSATVAGSDRYVVRALDATGASPVSPAVAVTVARGRPVTGAPSTTMPAPTRSSPPSVPVAGPGPSVPVAAPGPAVPVASPALPRTGLPTGLEAIAGPSEVALRWAAPTGLPVTGYYVYRGASSGAESGAAIFTTAASLTDRSVVPGVRYYYVVLAMTADGLSAPSVEASATGAAAPG